MSLVGGLVLGLLIALFRHFMLAPRPAVAYSALDDGRFARRERKDDELPL